jgi:hypothetical protein
LVHLLKWAILEAALFQQVGRKKPRWAAGKLEQPLLTAESRPLTAALVSA